MMRCDQELRLNGEGAKGVSEAAATAIPRRPAIARGFAFMGHGSSLPRDQRVQAFRRDHYAATYAHCP